jgi:hypothetical protein
MSVAQNQSNGAAQTSDTKKRRRHTFMYETMRKAAKKREAAQKASSEFHSYFSACRPPTHPRKLASESTKGVQYT